MNVVEVAVARDFCATPGGRYPIHGKGNGQDFREKFLEPPLREGKRLNVILDNAAGYPASFLEEAFGGLVAGGFSESRLKQLMEITAESREDEWYRDEAWSYIAEEQARQTSS